MSSSDSSSSEKFTGRVKWFNNKAGYGFVTVTDGSKSGSDVFIHHSAIKVDAEQYKYLVQGEYVEFTLATVEGGKHEFQAGEVCGIKGGKLMCETRNELKSARTTYKSVGQESQDYDGESSPRPISRQLISRVTGSERPPLSRQSSVREQTSSPRVPRSVRPPVEKRDVKPQQSDGEWTAVVNRKSKPVTDRPATKRPYVKRATVQSGDNTDKL
jgi:CspA family cold shock protein